MPRYKFKRDSYLSREEVVDMIDRAEQPWLKAIIALLYLYGLRISEALKLKPQDLSIEDKKLLVVRVQLSKKRKKATPIEPTHVLRVTMRKDLAEILRPLLHFWLKRESLHPDEPLWKWSRKTVWAKIKELNPLCSPHFFRHSRLYRLAELGASAAVLQDFAGWSDFRPASSYIQGSGQLARRFSDQID